jgi:hypothetical protein
MNRRVRLHRALDAVLDAEKPQSMQAITYNMMEKLNKAGWAMTKPADLNMGWCGTWAEEVAAKDPSAEIWATNNHMFIKKNGKYYDAATPGGVSDWRKLRGIDTQGLNSTISRIKSRAQGFGYNKVPR